MTAVQLEVSHRDIEEGDVVMRVHGGGTFLVEREVTDYAPGTIYLFGGHQEVYVRKNDGRWMDLDGKTDPALTDDRVREWVTRVAPDTIAYNPNDPKEV